MNASKLEVLNGENIIKLYDPSTFGSNQDLSAIYSGFSLSSKFGTFDTSKKEFESLKQFEKYFKDYDISFFRGGSGADIGPLKDGKIILAGLRPDPQRYFDYHHAASDTFDKINKRELELGAAAIASLVYLIDNYKL